MAETDGVALTDQDKLAEANALIDDVRSREDSPVLTEASADVWTSSQEGASPETPPTVTLPTTPPDAYLRGFTAGTHWDGSPYCIDWYPGPRGTWVGWPIGGTAYKESLMGPQGPMSTCVLVADDGYTDTFTHALDTMKLGRREAGELFCQVGDSGIEHLPGDPSHIHFASSQGALPAYGPDGPSGNVPALDRLRSLGFQIDIVSRIPGPQDYLAGRANAGRFV